jgi:hypothetical protein
MAKRDAHAIVEDAEFRPLGHVEVGVTELSEAPRTEATSLADAPCAIFPRAAL